MYTISYYLTKFSTKNQTDKIILLKKTIQLETKYILGRSQIDLQPITCRIWCLKALNDSLANIDEMTGV